MENMKIEKTLEYQYNYAKRKTAKKTGRTSGLATYQTLY
jgi:hypothetical protein